jgi:hypothetical protein
MGCSWCASITIALPSERQIIAVTGLTIVVLGFLSSKVYQYVSGPSVRVIEDID